MNTNILSGAFKGSELVIAMAGRNTGKSVFTDAMIQSYLSGLIPPTPPVSDLVLSEGKVYGARYLCVQPIGGDWKEMEGWCYEHYGRGSRSMWGYDTSKAPAPLERWYMNNSKFWFRNEKDRVEFILRWGP